MYFAGVNGSYGIPTYRLSTSCSVSKDQSRHHKIQHTKKSISLVKLELDNMLCKKKFCIPRPYETLSPACVVFWNDIEELSAELNNLKSELKELTDNPYLEFTSIEGRFYDV
jgi:hypothetical protein